ncbi:helix-turn-helix domain-containing protein [Streptomyces sp. NPDC048659]|uniref:NACHT N-terminal helical domain 7-containing protein n=1 Tax=Streptomyces sp. NPDC048659 TaxID=3155489 RepID=UPI00342F440A
MYRRTPDCGGPDFDTVPFPKISEGPGGLAGQAVRCCGRSRSRPKPGGQFVTEGGPSAVAHFCAALRHLVETHNVSQSGIARALGRSESTVSELLSGRRSTPPRLDDVLGIVQYCGKHSRTRERSGLSLDPAYWRARHAELEVVADRVIVERPRRPRSAEIDLWAWFDEDHRDVAGAVAILASGRARLDGFIDALLAPLALDGSPPADVHRLLSGYGSRVRGTFGMERTALLCAADVLVHVAAFCETVARADITPSEDWGAGPADVMTDALHELGQVDLGSFRTRDPAELRAELMSSYRAAGAVVCRPAIADSPSAERIARTAMRRYDALVSELAWSCPEFGLTSDSMLVPADEDEPPTRADRTGLGRLGSLLSDFAGGGHPRGRARARLRDPIAPVDVSGLVIPSLADGYVAPSFRFAPRPENRHLASDEWWERQPVREDLATFLAAYLLTERAVRAPLLVLGHPGSGKSLLTRLLEAHLPEEEFFLIRVELRHVSADLDVQEQIEQAMARATGRRTPWPDVVNEASGVVRVVLLDGFDELLQAGAQGRGRERLWGYLDEIERLQSREAQWGRPTVVVVTSRTVVADRAHLPATATVVRLEPFGEQHITRWLDIWAAANNRYFRERSLQPLTWEVVHPHEDLARQPLLLLMLALYDAAGNPLRLHRELGRERVEVYETLLEEFVRREVVKLSGSLPDVTEAIAVETELRRLGAIATGMFHRRSQSITATDAERDLAELLESSGSPLVFGRFFFVHESQAVVAEEELRTYEFLHATFGEHLAARLLCSKLTGLLDTAAPEAQDLDDRPLRALLSVVPLTDRVEVVRHVHGLLTTSGEARRDALVRLLRGLFAKAHDDNGRGTDIAYRPIPQSAVERDAVYGANLLLLCVVVAGELDLASFLPGTQLVADAWARWSHLWRSQFSDASWTSFTRFLAVRRAGGLRERWIGLRAEGSAETDSAWSVAVPTSRAGGFHTPDARSVAELARRVTFLGDADAAELFHALVPLLSRLPGALRTYVADPAGDVRSSAHALTNLVSGGRQKAGDVTAAYADLLAMLPHLSEEDRPKMSEILARQLTEDAAVLPGPTVLALLRALTLPAVTSADRHRLVPVWRMLIGCVHSLVGRPDVPQPELDLAAARLSDFLWGAERHQGLAAVIAQADTTQVWRHTASGTTDGTLSRHAVALSGAPPTERPFLTVGLLRLARELGRTDWLAEHAEPLLLTLDLASLGRLRATDVDALLPLVHDTALRQLLTRIRSVWRGGEAPLSGGTK